jgi:hypothetical protein
MSGQYLTSDHQKHNNEKNKRKTKMEKRTGTRGNQIKMTVFWVVAPTFQSCLLLPSSMIEAPSTPETSENFYQTTQRYSPEDKSSSYSSP